MDALSFSCREIHAYAFPPISLLHQVVIKIEKELSRIILIAPFWPREPWFPRILGLLTHTPIMLPKRPNLLSQPKSHLLHPDPDSFHLSAWMLSNCWPLGESLATAQAAKSRRGSTRRTSDSRLFHFTKWCAKRNVDPRHASLTHIGDFLLHLFDAGLHWCSPSRF